MNKKEYRRIYYIQHKEIEEKQRDEYNNSKIGRATHMYLKYKQADKEHRRGKGDLTAQWIVDNIFTKPCAHCGETDWKKLGCNRLDNSKPHTMDNVEPCCKKCNNKLNFEDMSKKVYQYTLDGELVKIWSSTAECGRNGFFQSHIGACCRGERKTHKGYKWSYKPL